MLPDHRFIHYVVVTADSDYSVPAYVGYNVCRRFFWGHKYHISPLWIATAIHFFRSVSVLLWEFLSGRINGNICEQHMVWAIISQEKGNWFWRLQIKQYRKQSKQKAKKNRVLDYPYYLYLHCEIIAIMVLCISWAVHLQSRVSLTTHIAILMLKIFSTTFYMKHIFWTLSLSCRFSVLASLVSNSYRFNLYYFY
jgi:hypothetical protein